MNTTENNNKANALIKELFKKFSNYTALSEGHYDYLVEEEDFEEAVLEFYKWAQKEN